MNQGGKNMILSDTTIQEFIESGKITVFPEFDPSDIRPAGIRLHLGCELLIPVPGQQVDLLAEQEVPFEKIQIPEEGFLLKPNQFVLASTYEKFQVPRNIVCHIDGRSTVARVGLSIHCTSGIIDGNFEEARTVVLEIKNQGHFEIILRQKMPLAMLSFTLLTTEIGQNMQKQYLGQDGVLASNLKMQKK